MSFPGNANHEMGIPPYPIWRLQQGPVIMR